MKWRINQSSIVGKRGIYFDHRWEVLILNTNENTILRNETHFIRWIVSILLLGWHAEKKRNMNIQNCQIFLNKTSIFGCKYEYFPSITSRAPKYVPKESLWKTRGSKFFRKLEFYWEKFGNAQKFIYPFSPPWQLWLGEKDVMRWVKRLSQKTLKRKDW